MRNRMFKRLVLILVIILTAISCYIIIKINSNKVKAQSFEKDKVIQTLANDKVENWNKKIEVLKDELHKQNQLIVLEGKRTIQCEYNNRTDYISDQEDKSNKLRWVYQKLADLKTKSIYITTSYNYSFVYCMNKLVIENDDKGNVKIKLYRGDILLKPLAEISSERVMRDDTNIISGKFTPQQISSVMNATQVHTYNNIVTDNELYNKALHNTSENIKELVSKLGLKNVNIEIIQDAETVVNDRVNVLEDNN